MLRLHLVAATPQATAEISVRVARRAVNQVQLEVGQSVTAEHRPYGLALAKGAKGGETSTFFLILADDWFNELESRPVVL